MKILFAESKDRTDVFRKIFETDIYNLITKRLVDKQKDYKESLKELKNTFATNAGNIIWMETPEVINNISGKELNKLDIIEIFDLLEKEIELNKEKYNNLNEKYEGLEKECKKLELDIKKQIEENNNIDKYDKLLNIRKDLESKEEYISLQKELYLKNQKILTIVLPKEERVLTLDKEIKKIQRDIESLKENISNGENKELLNKEKEKKIEKLKKKFLEYNNLNDECNELQIEKTKIIELDQVNKEIEKSIEIYNKISNDYKELNLKYLEEEERFFREQAGIIAEKLRDDEPCPVCGSKVHPCIASKSEYVLSKESLDKLKESCEKIGIENTNSKNKIIELKSKYSVLLSKINDSSDENFDLKKYFSNIEKKISTCINKIKKTETECSDLYSEICGSKLKINSFDYDAFKIKFEKSIKDDKDDLLKNKTLLKEFENQRKEKEKNLNNAKKDYEKAFKSLGFENEELYKNGTWEESKLKSVNKEIENYTKDVTENKALISELDKKLKTKEKRDIEVDNNILVEKQKELLVIKREVIDCKGILENNKRMNSSLKNTSKELLESIDEFVVIDELARTASRNVARKKKN